MTIVSLTQITDAHCIHLIEERPLILYVRPSFDLSTRRFFFFRPSQMQIAEKKIIQLRRK